MRKAVQLVHTLSYGDAISGEVLTLDRCLTSLGFESLVYAINVHPKLKGAALDYRAFPKAFEGELILHYSLGSPLNQLYENQTDACRSLIYHNLTPAHWFQGVNPRVAADIENGLEELPRLLNQTDRIFADSPFNAGEIRERGFEADVLELPVDPNRWRVEPNPGIASLIQSDPGIHVLHVGRLAPNKCVEDIIKSFYFLHHYISPQSKLWLVGIDIDTELYSYSLKRLVHELSLNDAVQFAGCLSDEEIKALYMNCSAYMCMSEHEGFCLPVVEAMHFGLPVIAYASSALPHTIGDGGILVHQKKHAELAELLHRVSTDHSLRSRLIAAGHKRVETLTFEKFESRVRDIFLSTQDHARSASVAV